jgi:hypothetical protein
MIWANPKEGLADGNEEVPSPQIVHYVGNEDAKGAEGGIEVLEAVPEGTEEPRIERWSMWLMRWNVQKAPVMK